MITVLTQKIQIYPLKFNSIKYTIKWNKVMIKDLTITV